MALLGAYHGLNPAMGWLFAVALGMQEGDRRAVVRALPAIAVGHEASIAVVAALVLGLGFLTDPSALHLAAGVALIGSGLFRFVKPRAHPRWVRGHVNRRELTWWSFLMSSAHGAGLMVAPVLIGAGAVASAAARAHAPDPARAGAGPGWRLLRFWSGAGRSTAPRRATTRSTRRGRWPSPSLPARSPSPFTSPRCSA